MGKLAVSLTEARLAALRAAKRDKCAQGVIRSSKPGKFGIVGPENFEWARRQRKLVFIVQPEGKP